VFFAAGGIQARTDCRLLSTAPILASRAKTLIGTSPILEMKAFNQEVANKIYTFLHYMFVKPDEDRDAFLRAMGAMYPKNWDQPKVDRDFVEAVKILKRIEKRFNQGGGKEK
jgi:hypothetical protein